MSTSTPQLTRRSFVKSAGVAGALVAGATVAAGSALADETSTAATEVSSAPDYSSWLGEEPKISDADVSEELSADVIVIGLADSGIPAVRAAVEEGATVLAFERCENYTATGGDVAVLGGSIQERYGRGEGFLDKREIAAEHQKECSYHTKLPIFKRWADEMGDMLDWFVDASGSYITEETFSEVPEENRDNYLYPYFVPMLESYDYTKEQMPCY
ncbi:MAG: succinate dehydrogenase, partial [Coriobacteriia bacterium]|nr:succinate dehydrogenase [Coriobacteriia bacterium]